MDVGENTTQRKGKNSIKDTRTDPMSIEELSIETEGIKIQLYQ